MLDLNNYISSNSSNFEIDYDSLVKDLSSNFGPGLPNVEKNESLRKELFNYSIDFAKKISIEYIEQYHNWLLQNYDIKPKN